MGIPTPAAEVKLINNFCIEIVVLVVLLAIFRTVVVAQSLPSVREHFVRAVIITQIKNASAAASLVAVFLHAGPHFFFQQQRGIVLAEPDRSDRQPTKNNKRRGMGRVTRGISCVDEIAFSLNAKTAIHWWCKHLHSNRYQVQCMK